MKRYITKAAYILGIPINVYKYEIGSCPLSLDTKMFRICKHSQECTQLF